MIYTELLIAAAILLIVFIVDRIRNRKTNLPPGPIGLPAIGYLPFLTKSPHVKFIQLGEKYGSIFSMYLGSQLVVVMNDGSEIREAFSSRELLARPPNFTLFGLQTPFFSPNFKLWQEQRRFVVQTMKDLGLGKSKIEGHIQDEILHFLKVLEQSDKRPIDFTKPVTPSMSNNICSLVFGERYDYENPERKILDQALNDIASNVGATSGVMFFPWLRHLPIILKILKNEKALKAIRKVFSIVETKVHKHKETLDPMIVRDFIDGYLLESQSRSETDPETTFTETNLKGITLNLFGGGSETVSTSITWCMYIIAAYPEVQKKVHKEIDDVIGSSKFPEYTDHMKMPYCQAVIREVLRWKTITPLNPPRYALDDIEISGVRIPKGAIVLANLWAIHHDPKYWTNPEEFKPERFINEDGTILKTNYFMPFSVGKRSCPGETMAMMEIFLYFVSILQKFRVSFPEGFSPTFETEFGITLRLKKFKLCFSPK